MEFASENTKGRHHFFFERKVRTQLTRPIVEDNLPLSYKNRLVTYPLLVALARMNRINVIGKRRKSTCSIEYKERMINAHPQQIYPHRSPNEKQKRTKNGHKLINYPHFLEKSQLNVSRPGSNTVWIPRVLLFKETTEVSVAVQIEIHQCLIWLDDDFFVGCLLEVAQDGLNR